jgi:hypothetical protein
VSSELIFPSAKALLICKEVELDSLAAHSTLFPPVTRILRGIHIISHDLLVTQQRNQTSEAHLLQLY